MQTEQASQRARSCQALIPSMPSSTRELEKQSDFLISFLTLFTLLFCPACDRTTKYPELEDTHIIEASSWHCTVSPFIFLLFTFLSHNGDGQIIDSRLFIWIFQPPESSHNVTWSVETFLCLLFLMAYSLLFFHTMEPAEWPQPWGMAKDWVKGYSTLGCDI